ncbi:MAG: DUF1573 domain-containing protein [Bacteroidia bacterium]|nr:MAG: DUF1573 domain-containing protein [Bacteroidia bacterium]
MFHLKHMRTPFVSTTVILCLLLCNVACTTGSEDQAKKKGQDIWFEEYLHDYGELLQHSEGTWSFAFKNVGKQAIVINQVRSTCGCTIPEWPREPIEPGGSGKITVIYNTALTGTFLKSIYVYSTAANSPVKLQIKGKVAPPKEEISNN